MPIYVISHFLVLHSSWSHARSLLWLEFLFEIDHCALGSAIPALVNFHGWFPRLLTRKRWLFTCWRSPQNARSVRVLIPEPTYSRVNMKNLGPPGWYNLSSLYRAPQTSGKIIPAQKCYPVLQSPYTTYTRPNTSGLTYEASMPCVAESEFKSIPDNTQAADSKEGRPWVSKLMQGPPMRHVQAHTPF